MTFPFAKTLTRSLLAAALTGGLIGSTLWAADGPAEKMDAKPAPEGKAAESKATSDAKPAAKGKVAAGGPAAGGGPIDAAIHRGDEYLIKAEEGQLGTGAGSQC